MLRRALLVVVALTVPAGLLLAVGPQDAWALPVGHGIANCPIYSGNGTVNPGLTPAGSPGGVKINFTASLTPPTGAVGCPNSNVTAPPGDKILGGTVTGSGYMNPTSGNGSSCAVFHTADVVGKISVKIHWQMSGAPIANTKIVYKNNPGTVSGAPTDTITLDAPPGIATKTGSFAAPPTTHLVQLNTTLPAPPCGPGPFSAFAITGGLVTV